MKNSYEEGWDNLTMILEVDRLTKAFGGLIAVKELSFEVDKGELMGMIGPNGSGKTTTFNCIAGYYNPTSGKVIFDGKDVTRKSSHERAKMGIARTFQLVKPFHNMTVLENTMVGALTKGASLSEAEAKVEEILDFIGLKDVMKRKAKELPIAMRKKVELARALALDPKLLLLDEVVAGLNPTEISEMLEVIKEINRRGVTIIMVEHVMKAVMSISKRIIVLHHGEKIAEGPPEEIANSAKVIEAYLGEKYMI